MNDLSKYSLIRTAGVSERFVLGSESYAHAHVLLDLLNTAHVGKTIRCEAFPRMLSICINEFSKINNI